MATNIMVARATHLPTRTTMIVIVVDDRNPVYLRDLGLRTVIDGRHFASPKADLRFLSRQEEKRFNRMATSASDWADMSCIEGDDARDKALDLAHSSINPAVAEAIRWLFR